MIVNGYIIDAEANLNGAQLGGADLEDAYLQNAKLIGADLSNANLSFSNLRGAYLDDANLANANLMYTSFLDAILYGADLSGTININLADMRGAYVNTNTILPDYISASKLSSLEIPSNTSWSGNTLVADPGYYLDGSGFALQIELPNKSPVFMTSDLPQATEGQEYEHTVHIFDEDMDFLTASPVNLPDWMSFEVENEAPGQISLKLSGIPSFTFLDPSLTEDIPHEAITLIGENDVDPEDTSALNFSFGDTVKLEVSDYETSIQKEFDIDIFNVNEAPIVRTFQLFGEKFYETEHDTVFIEPGTQSILNIPWTDAELPIFPSLAGRVTNSPDFVSGAALAPEDSV